MHSLKLKEYIKYVQIYIKYRFAIAIYVISKFFNSSISILRHDLEQESNKSEQRDTEMQIYQG